MLEKTLIFHHVPKAGGTSLLGALSNNFTRKDTFSAVRGTKWENYNNYMDMLSRRGRPYTLVLGHMPFGIHKVCDGPFQYISLVRDPVKRVVSLLEDIYRRESHYLHDEFCYRYERGGLDAILDIDFTPEISNEITRYFNWEYGKELIVNSDRYLRMAKANVDEYFGPIGLTEEFDSFLVLLRREAVIKKITYVRKNQTVTPRLNFNNAALEKIGELNAYDIEFYEHLKRRFKESISKLDMFSEEVERFRNFNSRFGRSLTLITKFRKRIFGS